MRGSASRLPASRSASPLGHEDLQSSRNCKAVDFMLSTRPERGKAAHSTGASLVDQRAYWESHYRDLFARGTSWLDYSNERVQLETFGLSLDASGGVTGRRC